MVCNAIRPHAGTDAELVKSLLLQYNSLVSPSACSSTQSATSTTTSLPLSLPFVPVLLNHHTSTVPSPMWPMHSMQPPTLGAPASPSSLASSPRSSPASSLKYAYLYPWAEVASVFHLPINAACEVRMLLTTCTHTWLHIFFSSNRSSASG